jgi:hypothetical protein
MRLDCFGVRAAKDVDFFDAVHSEPFEGVVEHGDVDERKKDFGGLGRDRAEMLQRERHDGGKYGM